MMVLSDNLENRGEFEGSDFPLILERAFLPKGIKVVSAGVTGRVVQEKKSESAAQLTDLERALILSKETGADALLQVGRLEIGGRSQRYFCASAAEPPVECTAQEFAASRNGRSVTGELVQFSGRLIDAQTGEILQALELAVPIVNGLNCILNNAQNFEPKLGDSCRRCSDQTWWCQRCREAELRALQFLVNALVRRVAAEAQPDSIPKQPGKPSVVDEL